MAARPPFRYRASVISIAVLAALCQLAPASWSARVTAPNGRFVAELRAAGPLPERGENLRLTVFEETPGEERRERWTGLVAHDLPPDARVLDLLTDDGAAFVRIVASPRAGVLVREVLKGTPAANLRADDLALAPGGDAEPWIDLATGLRWRPDDAGLNVHWLLDLLGRDGVVRTFDLDRSTVFVHADETRGAELGVHPPVPEPVRIATRESFVDDFGFPPFAYAGGVVELEGHGHFPSAGWRFIGFDLLGDPRTRGKLVLAPRAVFPQKAAAQLVERHLWTARVRGLPPGVYEVEVCGAETPAGDPRRDTLARRPGARTLELVSPHQIVELRRTAAAAGEFTRIALFDDGRFELERARGPSRERAEGTPREPASATGSSSGLAHGDAETPEDVEAARSARPRVELATLAEWERIETRVLALAPRSSTPAQLAEARAVLRWRTPARPERAALTATSPAQLLELAELLERCALRFESAPAAGK